MGYASNRSVTVLFDDMNPPQADTFLFYPTGAFGSGNVSVVCCCTCILLWHSHVRPKSAFFFLVIIASVEYRRICVFDKLCVSYPQFERGKCVSNHLTFTLCSPGSFETGKCMSNGSTVLWMSGNAAEGVSSISTRDLRVQVRKRCLSFFGVCANRCYCIILCLCHFEVGMCPDLRYLFREQNIANL